MYRADGWRIVRVSYVSCERSEVVLLLRTKCEAGSGVKISSAHVEIASLLGEGAMRVVVLTGRYIFAWRVVFLYRTGGADASHADMRDMSMAWSLRHAWCLYSEVVWGVSVAWCLCFAGRGVGSVFVFDLYELGAEVDEDAVVDAGGLEVID